MGLRSLLKGGSSKADEAAQDAEASSAQGTAAPPPYVPAAEDANAPKAPVLPPGYDEDDEDEDAPEYSLPIFRGDSSVAPATRKFPPEFNLYSSWKSWSTLSLGPSKEDKLFAVTVNWGWYARKAPVTIRDGPERDDPVLAQAGPFGYDKTLPCTIAVPTRPSHPNPSGHASNLPVDLEVRCAYHFHTWRKWAYRFEMPVGNPGEGGKVAADLPRETFEWRYSSSKELRALNDGSGSSIGGGGDQGKGKGKGKSKRAEGFATDGSEVVAVLAHSTGIKMTKPVRFAFLGTGLTGTLGESWEAVAVASGLQLWFYQLNSNNTASAVAAA